MYPNRRTIAVTILVFVVCLLSIVSAESVTFGYQPEPITLTTTPNSYILTDGDMEVEFFIGSLGYNQYRNYKTDDVLIYDARVLVEYLAPGNQWKPAGIAQGVTYRQLSGGYEVTRHYTGIQADYEVRYIWIENRPLKYTVFITAKAEKIFRINWSLDGMPNARMIEKNIVSGTSVPLLVSVHDVIKSFGNDKVNVVNISSANGRKYGYTLGTWELNFSDMANGSHLLQVDPSIDFNGSDAWAGTSGTNIILGNGNLSNNLEMGPDFLWHDLRYEQNNPTTIRDLSTHGWDGVAHGSFSTVNKTKGLRFEIAGTRYISYPYFDERNTSSLYIYIQYTTPVNFTGYLAQNENFFSSQDTSPLYNFDMQYVTNAVSGRILNAWTGGNGTAQDRTLSLNSDGVANDTTIDFEILVNTSGAYMYRNRVLLQSDVIFKGPILIDLQDVYNGSGFPLFFGKSVQSGIYCNQWVSKIIIDNSTSSLPTILYAYNISDYRQTDSSHNAGTGQVWKYFETIGTDTSVNTSLSLYVNGRDNNITFNGWELVNSSFNLNDNITIPAGKQYQYAKFLLYSNTTNQSQTNIISNFTIISGSPTITAPIIISWSNSNTSNSTNNFTIPEGTWVTFNATADQDIVTWNWYIDNISQAWNYSNWSHKFFSEGSTRNITVTATNANGTGTHQWNVTVVHNSSYIAPVVPPAYPAINYTYANMAEVYDTMANINWTDDFVISFREGVGAVPSYIYEFNTSSTTNASGPFNISRYTWYETITPTTHFWSTQIQYAGNGTWQTLGVINENLTDEGYAYFNYSLTNISLYRYANGTVYLRTLHSTNGNPAHWIHDDMIRITLDTYPAPEFTITSPEQTFSSHGELPQTFSATVNQIGNFSWYLNGSLIQSNNSTTTAAYYNNSSEIGGPYNVTVIFINANGTIQHTWGWTVHDGEMWTVLVQSIDAALTNFGLMVDGAGNIIVAAAQISILLIICILIGGIFTIAGSFFKW